MAFEESFRIGFRRGVEVTIRDQSSHGYVRTKLMFDIPHFTREQAVGHTNVAPPSTIQGVPPFQCTATRSLRTQRRVW